MNFITQRIVIVFLLIAIAALALRSCFRKERENIVLQEAVQIKEDSTSFWKDYAGREHAQKRELEADIQTIKILYRSQVDSLTTLLNIQAKDLQSVAIVKTSASGSIVPTVDTVLIDSTYSYPFHYSDKWLTLDGVISSQPFIRYLFSDSLIVTSYTKRTGLFKRQTFIDAYSLNPNVRFQNITGIRIRDVNTRRFGFGPYVGFGWDGMRLRPSAGLSFHYSLIRF